MFVFYFKLWLFITCLTACITDDLEYFFKKSFFLKNCILTINFLLIGSESWVQRSCGGRMGKVSESNASRGSGINMWNNKLQACRVNKQN